MSLSFYFAVYIVMVLIEIFIDDSLVGMDRDGQYNCFRFKLFYIKK